MKLGNADFSDYLIVRINQQAGCDETALSLSPRQECDRETHQTSLKPPRILPTEFDQQVGLPMTRILL
ncbi:MAG: hypothetical protein R6U67_15145 [Sodalinema sp.]|uniref:hypothetical protein n=1 Tax=Sodalinema sp. TaxID=3080550 RepID=UPI00396F6366